jgi:hypothetical protein
MEYLEAARKAGLRVDGIDDISHRTEHFWTTTVSLMEAEAVEKSPGPAEMARLQASMRAHRLVRQGLADGGLRYALMSFFQERQRFAGSKLKFCCMEAFDL